MPTEATSPQFRLALCGDYERFAIGAAPWSTLGNDVEIKSFTEPFLSPEATVSALRDFDAITLMRERTPLSRSVLEQLPRLRLIVFTGRSNSTLDTAAAIDRHIVVCNVSSSLGGGSAAELALGLMLACAWHLPAADALIRLGGWAFRPGISLRGKTLGLLGYGKLGKSLAGFCLALGMTVLAFSRGLTDEKAKSDGVTRADLETLLRSADVVSIHLPLTPETIGMIGHREIDMMKRGVLLINTARAPIVDQQAMLHALKSGHIGMAGLDVFDAEPLPKQHPLRQLTNVVMTPHIGYVNEANLTGMYGAALDVLTAFRKGVVKNRYTPS
jgi:phosphoglycerate dehydrogenase-like enzyme